MKVFPDRIQATVEKSLAGVYLVAGPETLLVEESADHIRKAAKRHGVDERVVLDAEGRFDWNQLSQATQTGSLFASRRLVEVRLRSGKPGKEGAAALREWLNEPGDDVLFIKCNEWEMASEKTVWFKAVEERGVFVPCWTIKAHQLPKWIAARLASRGLSVDRLGAEFLADRLEGNILAAAQEVERLAILHPSGHRLALAELKEAVSDHARFDVFRLVELVFTGQPGAAIRCIRGLIEADTPKPAVVSAIARELQVVGAYQVLGKTQGSAQAFKALNIWPSRQGAVEAAARRLAPKTVAAALAQLSVLDRMSKSNDSHRLWVGVERLSVALASQDHGALLEEEGLGDVA